MLVSKLRGLPPARSQLQKSHLNEKRLVNLFDGLHLFAERGGKRVDAHRPPAVFFDDRQQELAVHLIKAAGIDFQHIERTARHRRGDVAVGLDLREVPHAAQQAVGDARRAAAAARNLGAPALVHLHFQDFGGAAHDDLNFLRRVKVEAMHDAEAAPHRPGKQSGPRGGADQGEWRELHLDGAGRRPLPHHVVDVVVLHGRIK